MEIICQCGKQVSEMKLESDSMHYVDGKIERTKRFYSAQCKECKTVYGINEVKFEAK